MRNDLGRIDDALLREVAVLAGLGIVAEGVVTRVEDLACDHRAILTCVLGNLSRWCLQRTPHDVNANFLVVVGGLESIKRLQGAHQGHTATGDDTFLNSSAGGIQRIVDAVLLP